MSKPSVTYQELRNIVYNYIVNNCANIDARYDSMNASFKSGWASGKTLMPGADNRENYGAWAYYRIYDSTSIAQVAATTVSSELDAFITNNMGISNRAEVIPASDLLNVIRDLTSFCISTIYFAKSPWYTAGIIYYKSNSGYPNSKVRTTPTADVSLVTANEIRGTMSGSTVNKDGLFDTVTTYLKHNSYRNGNPRYNVQYTHTP